MRQPVDLKTIMRRFFMKNKLDAETAELWAATILRLIERHEETQANAPF